VRARVAALGVLALVLVPASASAGAGTSAARPPVALTASPSRVELVGSASASVRLTNSGATRVLVDVVRAGFALDLRGRPKIVPVGATSRSAVPWIGFRPRTVALGPGHSSSVTLTSKLPASAEPGDHDALVLFTTRRRAQDGVAVRMRMGVVVVVRAPGEIVRRVRARGMRVARRGRLRTLELRLANLGNVTESFRSTRSLVSLERRGRRLARLRAAARELRPATRGILEFRCPRSLSGPVIARVDVSSESGQVIRRAFRIRL
jgi:hypothetical protein